MVENSCKTCGRKHQQFCEWCGVTLSTETQVGFTVKRPPHGIKFTYCSQECGLHYLEAGGEKVTVEAYEEEAEKRARRWFVWRKVYDFFSPPTLIAAMMSNKVLAAKRRKEDGFDSKRL